MSIGAGFVTLIEETMIAAILWMHASIMAMIKIYKIFLVQE